MAEPTVPAVRGCARSLAALHRFDPTAEGALAMRSWQLLLAPDVLRCPLMSVRDAASTFLQLTRGHDAIAAEIMKTKRSPLPASIFQADLLGTILCEHFRAGMKPNLE